jgi:hypothetical protein
MRLERRISDTPALCIDCGVGTERGNPLAYSRCGCDATSQTTLQTCRNERLSRKGNPAAYRLVIMALIVLLATPTFAQSACDYPHTFCRGSYMSDGTQTKADMQLRAKFNERSASGRFSHRKPVVATEFEKMLKRGPLSTQ